MPHLYTAGCHVDRLVVVVLAGGQRLLLVVVRRICMQGGPARGRVVPWQDVNLPVVIHLQLPVLRVVAKLLSKEF